MLTATDDMHADPELSRLRWQCRRGMRELDDLLLRYLESRYATAGRAEKSAFRELLMLSDPELANYLLKGARLDEEAMNRVVGRILEYAKA